MYLVKGLNIKDTNNFQPENWIGDKFIIQYVDGNGLLEEVEIYDDWLTCWYLDCRRVVR